MNCIVITSINYPTEAVHSFSKLKNYKLIVVGDKKTPSDWSCKDTVFLSVKKQLQIGRHLNKILPYNHYCRKMLGYLYAFKLNAQCIVDTDDDNIPKAKFSFPDFKGKYNVVKKNQGFINIYQYFTEQKIWPRGLPLKDINQDYKLNNHIKSTECKVGVWQGLADQSPDVDAIYRFVDNRPCFFEEREPIVLSEGTLSPFNTQNTLICKELFPLLYLPAHVTFRFTDILRSLVAQPIMWLHGYNLGFIGATVTQKRNPHDYFEDFISEIPMYQNTEKVVEIVIKTIKKQFSMSENLFIAYEALLDAGIVKNTEIDVLTAWLKEIDQK